MSGTDLKVVLLGKVAVGKTWLVERYMNDRCTAANTTIGAAFSAKHLDICGKTVKLNIWDTAGAERFEAMAKSYYRGANAAIVCYDLTDNTSLDKAVFWIKELNKNVESCKVYLCGTKKDIVDSHPERRQIAAEDVQRVSTNFNADIVETSSLTGENVKYLFQKIAEEYVKSLAQSPKPTTADMTDVAHLTAVLTPKKRMRCCKNI